MSDTRGISPQGNVNRLGHEENKWQYVHAHTVLAEAVIVGGKVVSLNGHDHDDSYYTQTEIDNKLKAKANSNHSHSDYLKAEDIAGKADKDDIDKMLRPRLDDDGDLYFASN